MRKVAEHTDCASAFAVAGRIAANDNHNGQAHHLDGGFSLLTQLRVRHRASRLARVFGLDSHGHDDIRQQLWLRAVQAADRYQPDRGATLDHFVRLHLDYEYRTLRTELLAERAFRDAMEDGPRPDRPSHAPDHRPASDLRLDLEAAEERLPQELRAVALKLRSLTPAQIAAERGVHRGTVYREMTLLRGVLEEFLSSDDDPRDKFGGGAERSCGTVRAGRPAPGASLMPDPPASTCPASASRADRGRS